MANQLWFKLKKVANPYSETHPADLWGQLDILILTGKKAHLLLQTQWNLETLAEWFTKNQAAFSQNELLIQEHKPLPGESLAEAFRRLRTYDFEEEAVMFRWDEALDDYYQQHSLRAALPGANVPGYIIGWHKGAGEISFEGDSDKNSYPTQRDYYANLKQWSYSFDMADFVTDLQQQLKDFLESWTESGANQVARTQASNLLKQLSEKALDKVLV